MVTRASEVMREFSDQIPPDDYTFSGVPLSEFSNKDLQKIIGYLIKALEAQTHAAQRAVRLMKARR